MRNIRYIPIIDELAAFIINRAKHIRFNDSLIDIYSEDNIC